MHIDWTSLATVVVVSAAATVSIVVLVSVALVAFSTEVGTRSRPRLLLSRAVGGVCVLASTLLVGYALYLIAA